MANSQHLKILKKGVTFWNSWRLGGCNGHQIVEDADLRRANLKGADLRDAEFAGADLRGVDLTNADLEGADLSNAELSDAALTHCNLACTFLSHADLTSADLSKANLAYANLSGAFLSKANFTDSVFGNTTLADIDLSEVKGLETSKHLGPSSIGLDTFYKSKGKIPKAFLQGTGIPDDFIQYSASLTKGAFEFYSCFISYSTRDEKFTSRLHEDLQAEGIHCWKWNHDARTGRSLWREIDSAIRNHDKLVLIASKSSLKSPAVIREIERALREEDTRQKRRLAGHQNEDSDVLFPVRLDDYLIKSWQHELKADVIRKVVADARNWDTHPTVYRRVLNKLKHDLKKGILTVAP